jgi:hypothetical protein
MNTPLESTRVTRDGVSPSAITTDGTDLSLQDNDGNIVLHVVGTPGAEITAHPTATVAGGALADVTCTLPAEGFAYFGPFPPVVFNDALGDVIFTADTGLAITAIGI